ncbi:MAG: DUF512 domain-containing protein [Bacillota bacterium]|jgi:putative radical SAM enzyme (TIGR03279 family)|nr:DUF512 domain-containing protein [Bacillota bacterium]HHU42927.1 DUF512 domain-containing protein [Clostridiales bacterium]
MAKVKKISRKGILYRKIKKGEDVVAFENRPFEDILDYIYADSKNTLSLTFIDKKKRRNTLKIEKNDFETMGLEFDESISIKPKICHNKCIFCFVDQLPKGMRNTLYVKDDDYRLSFVSGNYITLTNLTDKDMERIISYKLSPLYISVHSTDEDIRKKMLGIKKAQPILDTIKKLVQNDIKLHTQIVLVPDVNDICLENTIEELKNAQVETVAVVPVGLTKHRQGLFDIKRVDKKLARKTIGIVERLYDKYPFFCYASDEMYQIAELPVKDYGYYGGFEQIENGVGLIAKFLYEIELGLQDAPNSLNKSVAVLTGMGGQASMQKAKEMIKKRIKGLEINIYTIKNRFFGESVTVSGLVTGRDIIKELEKKDVQGDYIIIPSVMLKELKKVFLDGVSVRQLEKSLKKKIVVSPVDGECFVNAIKNGANKW